MEPELEVERSPRRTRVGCSGRDVTPRTSCQQALPVDELRGLTWNCRVGRNKGRKSRWRRKTREATGGLFELAEDEKRRGSGEEN